MLCRITDMHSKEVINVCDGTGLGCVDDVEVDTCTAQLVAIVIHGRPKCMGLMGHEDDIVIGWKEIEVIGEETILDNHTMPCCEPPQMQKTGRYHGRHLRWPLKGEGHDVPPLSIPIYTLNMPPPAWTAATISRKFSRLTVLGMEWSDEKM